MVLIWQSHGMGRRSLESNVAIHLKMVCEFFFDHAVVSRSIREGLVSVCICLAWFIGIILCSSHPETESCTGSGLEGCRSFLLARYDLHRVADMAEWTTLVRVA
jgi:hypothetical protein